MRKKDEVAFVQRKSTKIKSQNGFPVLTSILDNVQDRRDEFSRCLGSLATNINDSSLQVSPSSIIPAVSKKQQQNIMDCELRLKDSDVLITDSVLDFSKYLTSSDLPASPEEFFDDLFVDDQLEKSLPCPVKVKQEPCYSSASSRCSTPESLLPEHDFENIDIPSPKFYSNDCRQDSLVYQLQTASQCHNKTVPPNKSMLHHKLQQAFTEFQDVSEDPVGSPVAHVPKKVKSSQKAGKRKSCDKTSEEYRVKRERNNVAVRKSRTKSKMKHIETEVRVSELTEENEQLRSKVVLLQRELAALRNFVALNAPAVVAKAPGFFSSAVPNNIDNPSIYLNCTDKSKIVNGRVDRVC